MSTFHYLWSFSRINQDVILSLFILEVMAVKKSLNTPELKPHYQVQLNVIHRALIFVSIQVVHAPLVGLIDANSCRIV